MSKKQVSGTHTAVKSERQTRSNARFVIAAVRAVMNEYEAELIDEPGAERAKELLRDLDAWVDGGPVPASAKRYSALLRATDRVEPGYTSAGADAAEAAIVAEYCSITFASTLTGLLECAAGDFSHEKPDHLLAWFADDISSLPANDNALRLKHLIKACA